MATSSSVVHPFEATAARLDSSRVVSLFNEAGTLHKEVTDVFEEWVLKTRRWLL